MANESMRRKILSTAFLIIFLLLGGLGVQKVISNIETHNDKMKNDPNYRKAVQEEEAQEYAEKLKRYGEELKQWEEQEKKRKDEKIAEYNRNLPYYKRELEGSFELRKFQPQEILAYKSEARGSLFFLFGSYESSAEGKQVLMERFSWKNKDGIYVNSELPFIKLRENLDPKSEKPRIDFIVKRIQPVRVADPRYRDGWIDCLKSKEHMEIDFYLENCIEYAVITCKPEEWEENIKLPLN